MALPAIGTFGMAAEDFGPGNGAAVASCTVLAHENAVWNYRRSARIETVGVADGLRETDEVIFVKQFVLSAENMTLLAVTRAANARCPRMGIGWGEAHWRRRLSRSY